MIFIFDKIDQTYFSNVEWNSVVNLTQQEVERKIFHSLYQNKPIIFLTEINSLVMFNYPNGSSELGTHFITITGIERNTITNETIITASSWSKIGNVSLNELYTDASILSSIITIN